ncbi:MAG: prepilin peptidase [Candidatus Neomarinimicrobiota bacterium]|jgi:leader peptidase (prepilin peptidase)/N-methyltransferase|nr:prepilin peptidase [Candidatus Neomarinimicrobiota bacterium]|tara:strand:- start:929 stop:1693 length:765 start_codon:yes stop_codon:yes gene_type:complete
MDWAIFVPFFIFGTLPGSFLNVLIYRIPEEISIVSPRSFCPHCKTPIPFYRNIPILTFLFQGGKCRICQKKISVQYPLVEFISGVIWGWTFSNYNWQSAMFLSLLISVLLVIAWIDFKEMIIPLNMLLTGVIIIILGVGFQILSWRISLYGSIVGPTAFGFILGITYLVSKRMGMGSGDIQLSAILGAWQGPVNIVLIFFVASFFSLLCWTIVSLFQGFDKNRALPFAPFLVFSAVTIFVTDFYMRTSIFELFK